VVLTRDGKGKVIGVVLIARAIQRRMRPTARIYRLSHCLRCVEAGPDAWK